jgi:dTDP-4-amino-4,6-dideoxygalactose transaminase
MGMPCDLTRLVAIAKKYSVALIEDAACAIGSEFLYEGAWEKIGKPHGDAACFSFHPRKIVSTGDGGMITTRHKDWDERFRLWRQHGMSVSDTTRHSSAQVMFESYAELGFNYRMTDIQAAVGQEQLKRVPEIIARRRDLAARYRALLGEVPALKLPTEPLWARSNWQSFCVSLAGDCPQRDTMQALLDLGIATRRGIMCAHREPAYQNQPWRAAGPLLCSEHAQETGMILPLYPQMNDADHQRIVLGLRQILTRECVF